MDELTPNNPTRESYTAGWICALDVELAASMVMLDYELPSLPQAEGDTNTYILGRIGQHSVVLTCLPSGTTGTNAAANAATNMLRSFPNIRFCLMIGIGGGAPAVPSDDPCKDIRLGDVVVSCPSANSGGVLQYDFGKTMSEGKFVQTSILNRTSIVLSNSVSALRARHRIEGSRIPQFVRQMLESNRMMQRDYSHPGLEHDQLFRADFEHPTGEPTCHSCDIKALVPRILRENANPVIHYGLIGSANQVMKHGVTRDRLRDEKNIICFEMEAAGLMDVIPCLVVRGICDYADSHKNKRWQPYAAVTAAACAKEILLATPTSELSEKSFYNEKAICDMLRTTLCEFNWVQLLKLLPLKDYKHDEYLELPRNIDDHQFHWTSKNIDYRQWNLNEGPRVLCLTGYPSEGIIYQLSSYIINREKAAGYTILPLSCISMKSGVTIGTLFYIFLQELVYYLPEAQRTLIIRNFFGQLLENPDIRGRLKWKEDKFDGDTFSKYMTRILESATVKDLLSTLRTPFDFERQTRLLVAISNLEVIESMNNPDCCALQLIKHLQQRKPNIKLLVTSSEKYESTSHLEKFLHIAYDKERKECLQSLQFDNTRYDKISEEYKGSFEWIWTHNEYESWSVSDTSKLLYVQGKPGSGKSTLMKYFNRNLLLKESGAQTATVARFFYSFRDGELQRSHYHMLLSILYEILYQDENFFYHKCQTEYRVHHRCGSHFKWTYDSLKRTLQSLQDYRRTKRFYLIIDAVDESEEKDRREILGLLLELCSKTKHCVVKIFMASRPVAQLEARRHQFHSFIKLDDETRSDIYSYAQSLLNGLSSTDLLEQATLYILKNAQGVFLWVKLITEQLIEAHEDGYSEEEIFELLKQLPTELEDFYVLMLKKMKQNKSSLLYAPKMFRFILFARRPLTVDEILHALGIPDSVGNDPRFIPSDAAFAKRLPSSERVILSSGGNFLEISRYKGRKIVQIMHQTVREFFLNSEGPVANSVFWVSETHAHVDLATTCIRYLTVCVTNTSLVGKLPTVDSWDTLLYQDYCQYLDRRPLAPYALSYIKSHIDASNEHTSIEYAASRLNEQLTNCSAGAFLLKKCISSRLYQGSSDKRHVHDTTEMNFRCEILRHSCISGFRTAAELVLLAETNVDSQDEDGRTPLSLAANHGHEAIVKLLLDKDANIHIKDRHGHTPISWAAMNGHRNIVLWLSDHGAVIDETNYYNRAPLSCAAERGHLTIVEFLVEKGAFIERSDQYNKTPISWAAENGHLDIVKFLFDEGAIIESLYPHETPISRAAKNGHLAVVEFLYHNGARIAPMLSSETPLSLAAMHGHLAMVEFLYKKSANFGPTHTYEMPLLRAAEHGHLAVVEFLIEKGASVERRDRTQKSPLSWAAEHGHLAIVNCLVEKGASVDDRDNFHKTPLLLAVEHNHFDVVKFLAMKGASIEIMDGNGKTPVSIAAENDRPDIVKFLVEMCLYRK